MKNLSIHTRIVGLTKNKTRNLPCNHKDCCFFPLHVWLRFPSRSNQAFCIFKLQEFKVSMLFLSYSLLSPIINPHKKTNMKNCCLSAQTMQKHLSLNIPKEKQIIWVRRWNCAAILVTTEGLKHSAEKWIFLFVHRPDRVQFVHTIC